MSWKLLDVVEKENSYKAKLEKEDYRKIEKFNKEDWAEIHTVNINGKDAEVQEWKKFLIEKYKVDIV